MTNFMILCICAGVFAGVCRATAEVPGEFRPKPVGSPAEKAHATGDKVQPADQYPQSRALLVNTARRKPKLAQPGQPLFRGNELVCYSTTGCGMIAAA